MSDPAFFSSGRTTGSFLTLDGMQPIASDLLNSNVTKGDSNAFTFLTRHVGAGWSRQVLYDAEPISFSSSSVVTCVQFSKVGVDLDGTSYDGVVMVDCMDRINLVCGKIICYMSTGVVTRRLTQYALSVCHSRCVLPWDVAISLCQNVEFFSLYNYFILLNSADQAR